MKIRYLTRIRENLYIKYKQKELMGEQFVCVFLGDQNGTICKNCYFCFSIFCFSLYQL